MLSDKFTQTHTDLIKRKCTSYISYITVEVHVIVDCFSTVILRASYCMETSDSAMVVLGRYCYMTFQILIVIMSDQCSNERI